jgi:hypothetical protein
MPATFGLHQPTGKTLLHERIRGRAEGIASKMPVQGENALYKVASVIQRARGRRAHVKTMATEEPAARQPAN